MEERVKKKKKNQEIDVPDPRSTMQVVHRPKTSKVVRTKKHVRKDGAGTLGDAIQPGALLRSLLDEPVRFVSSSRDELKASMSLDKARAAHYEVVNAEEKEKEKEEAQTMAPTPKKPASEPLYAPRIIPRFPRTQLRACGLHNHGNTCYLNSVMQALVHTPPLAAALLTQSAPTLLGRLGVPRTQKQALKAAHMFNTLTALKEFVKKAYSGAGAISPTAFVNNLRKFARPLRPGRQEDAHEYLRLLLESLQQACTAFAGKDMKPGDPIFTTTLVQRIFGGKLRSRVTCHSCRHNSDTFDPVLDLSLDVRKGIHSVKQALDAFTAPEALSDKYKCESCKRSVDATKRFTIEQAPVALTIHLKRFGIFGNKINKPVSYTERLHLGRYMSERQKGLSADDDDEAMSTIGAAQQYRLYAVVHHYGSGPNVGHYVASVRSPDGRWLRMDDSYVSTLPQCPLDDPSAYLLFYVREPIVPDTTQATSPQKRKVRRDDALGEPVPRAVSMDDAVGEPISRAEYEALEHVSDSGSEAEPPLSKKDRRRKRRKTHRRPLS